MACAVAALTAQSLLGHDVTAALVALTVPALALDAVDGRVARRTGTVSAFGGRFDGEVDAFLILVLSVAAGPVVGWWVLAAGLVRYAFAVAGWVLPWMRAPLEYRYWRKVVTASVGILLTVAVAQVLPPALTLLAVVVALGLLAESFGRDVGWLWRHRPTAARMPVAHPPRPGRGRRGVAIGATVLAVALVWFALVAPTRPDRLTPGAFVRLPVEVLVLAVLALLVSARSARAVTLVVGTALAVVTLLKVLDLGAFAVLDRPFNVVTDRAQLGSGFDFVRDSLGPWAARAARRRGGRAGRWPPWCACPGRSAASRRRCRSTAPAALRGRRGRSPRCGRPVPRCRAAAWHRTRPSPPPTPGRSWSTRCGPPPRPTATRRPSSAPWPTDAFGDPASADLSALRGKDVVLAFVESYGRVALDGPEVRCCANPVGQRNGPAATGWATRHPVAGSPPPPSAAAAGSPTRRCSRG